jgi:hypothetical protein
MRAKLINEDFKEQSDPIEDMGIGTCQKNVMILREKLQDMWDEYYERTLDDEDVGAQLNLIERIQNIIDNMFG